MTRPPASSASRAVLAGALPATLGLAAVLLLPRNGGARQDRWTALRAAQLERSEVAAARIGRSIYVIGGFERLTDGTVAAVERYDIRRDRWTSVPDMPVALNHPTAVAHRGRLYVHGGYRAERDLAAPTGTLLRYNPEGRRWRRLPSAPTPRAAHALAAIRAASTPRAAPTTRARCSRSRSTTSSAGAGAAARASPARRETTRRAWRPAAASTCSRDGTPAT